MRRIGFIGVLVTLLSAVGALAPMSASADPAFTAAQYPATIQGTSAVGNEQIKTEGGSVECKSSFHAEAGGESATLNLAPTYSECKAFGFLNATVHPNGCKYRLHLVEETSVDKYKASFDIACEAGKAIVVTAATCQLEIKSQAGLGSVALANNTEASPKDITFDPEVAGLAYTVTTDGFGCPFNGTGNKTGGTYTAGSPITLAGQVAVDIG